MNEDGSMTVLTGKEVLPAGSVVRVYVSGKGNYTGEEISTTYRITAASIAKGTFKIRNQEYTGNAITIGTGDITTAKAGKSALTYGTDYVIVGYSNNVKKGYATVTFQGIGNYGGTKTVKFKITQRSIKLHWDGILGWFF